MTTTTSASRISLFLKTSHYQNFALLKWLLDKLVEVDFKRGLVSLGLADTVSLSPERLSMNDCSDVEVRATKRAHSYLYLRLLSLSMAEHEII